MNPSGILLVDKPPGITSAEAIRKIERHFGVPKIGHGGTLDPFATGLLIVLIGDATKISRFLLADKKEYSALATLGLETTTGDRDGELTGERIEKEISKEEWLSAFQKFLGKTRQVPPRYSAIKVGGKRLYEYARANQAVEIESREIEVFSLSLLSNSKDELAFQCESGGGTYIRTLAEDLAKAVGTRAHLKELRRLRVGSFALENAYPLDDLLKLPANQLPPMVSIPTALQHLPQLHCPEALEQKIRAGNQAALIKLEIEHLRTPKFEGASFALLLHGSEENPLPLALLARESGGVSSFKLDRVFL